MIFDSPAKTILQKYLNYYSSQKQEKKTEHVITVIKENSLKDLHIVLNCGKIITLHELLFEVKNDNKI